MSTEEAEAWEARAEARAEAEQEAARAEAEQEAGGEPGIGARRPDTTRQGVGG